MAHTTAQRTAPPRSRRGACLLAKAKAVFRALRRHRARAARAAAAERQETVIKEDLAHLDRHMLRDIGLDRDVQ